MNNSVCINNWNDKDREVLFEPLRGDTNRQDKKVCINNTLLDRFQKLHPQQANGKHKGTTLSDAVNKGLLLYMKLYEQE